MSLIRHGVTMLPVKPFPVDAFPEGKSPFGMMDLTGNVWQLTGDVYNNGTYYFVIMKGGSFYKPTSSWWYVKGGPQPNNWHQQLLLVSPSFDRNATVGFRCVKDASPGRSLTDCYNTSTTFLRSSQVFIFILLLSMKSSTCFSLSLKAQSTLFRQALTGLCYTAIL